jgi:hypothetical protein
MKWRQKWRASLEIFTDKMLAEKRTRIDWRKLILLPDQVFLPLQSINNNGNENPTVHSTAGKFARINVFLFAARALRVEDKNALQTTSHGKNHYMVSHGMSERTHHSFCVAERQTISGFATPTGIQCFIVGIRQWC